MCANVWNYAKYWMGIQCFLLSRVHHCHCRLLSKHTPIMAAYKIYKTNTRFLVFEFAYLLFYIKRHNSEIKKYVFVFKQKTFDKII